MVLLTALITEWAGKMPGFNSGVFSFFIIYLPISDHRIFFVSLSLGDKLAVYMIAKTDLLHSRLV